jgi:hypothetical protein
VARQADERPGSERARRRRMTARIATEGAPLRRVIVRTDLLPKPVGGRHTLQRIEPINAVTSSDQ